MHPDGQPGTAFEDFVHARSAGLFRTALLLAGNNRPEAEDLVQVCLERAYRHWNRISRQGGEPERYARRILVNAANDRWRRLRRRPEYLLGAEPAAAEPGIPDQSGALADRDVLVRALSALPQRQRSAIVLRYFDDLEITEIAAMLGCSVGTVRSHVSRGLATMRQAIGDVEPDQHSHPERREGARP